MSHYLGEIALSFLPTKTSDAKSSFAVRLDYALSLLLFLFLETSLKCKNARASKQTQPLTYEKTNITKYQPLIYHGCMCREVAEDTLIEKSPGTFLIRTSKTAGKDYVLSLRLAISFYHI